MRVLVVDDEVKLARDVRADQAARPGDEDPHRPTTARTDSLSERVVASTAVGS